MKTQAQHLSAHQVSAADMQQEIRETIQSLPKTNFVQDF